MEIRKLDCPAFIEGDENCIICQKSNFNFYQQDYKDRYIANKRQTLVVSLITTILAACLLIIGISISSLEQSIKITCIVATILGMFGAIIGTVYWLYRIVVKHREKIKTYKEKYKFM